MSCHLAHKLPWDSIHELALVKPDPDLPNPPRHQGLNDAQRKKLVHFGRCLAAAVTEFIESDRSSDEERQEYDPRTWELQRETGAGAWPGFYETLLSSYVILNLLLMDPERFQHRCERGYCEQYFLQIMMGRYDGQHPPHLAAHLGLAMEMDARGVQIKPLTRETMQVIRDHAAMLFRCMYSISERNHLVDGEYIASVLEQSFFG